MVTYKNKLATDSFQFLRGKAHWMLERIFPGKHQRYRWLKRNMFHMHISQMNKHELRQLIYALNGIYEKEQ